MNTAMLLIHGTGYLHDPQVASPFVPRVGEQLILGQDRFYVIEVRYLFWEDNKLEFVHVDVAPSADNESRTR